MEAAPPSEAAPRPARQRSPSGTRSLARAPLLLPVAIFAICRIPSFFEPHWYTDEAGYAVSARAVISGEALYRVAFTNKPPLQIWSVAIPLKLFGTSEAGLHLLTFLTGLLALLGVWDIARQLLSPRRALLATTAVAGLLGVPIFDAELVVPESLLIAPVTWAGALLVRLLLASPGRPRRTLLAVGAGALVGMGLGVQQTVLADTAVFALALSLNPRSQRRDLVLFLASAVAVVLAWMVPALIVAGADRLLFSLVGFYTGYVATSAPGRVGLFLRAAAAATAVVGAWRCRHADKPTWLLWLWATSEFEVAALAHRGYPHLILGAVAPAVLALASISVRSVRPHWGRWVLAAGMAVSGLFAAVVGIEDEAMLAYVYWPVSVVTDRPKLWTSTFNQDAQSNPAVASWLQSRHLNRGPTVLWASDAWIYLLADVQVRLPAAPIYNDVVLLGSSQAVVGRVAQVDPNVVVTNDADVKQWPDIIGFLRRRGYRLAYRSGADSVFVRGGLVMSTVMARARAS